MIFQWDPEVPLVVDENIELPQLALVKNYTADCSQVYSTGSFLFFKFYCCVVAFLGNFTCLEVVFELKRRLGYYLFHTYIPTCLIVIMSVSANFLNIFIFNLFRFFFSGFLFGFNLKQLLLAWLWESPLCLRCQPNMQKVKQLYRQFLIWKRLTLLCQFAHCKCILEQLSWYCC